MLIAPDRFSGSVEGSLRPITAILASWLVSQYSSTVSVNGMLISRRVVRHIRRRSRHLSIAAGQNRSKHKWTQVVAVLGSRGNLEVGHVIRSGLGGDIHIGGGDVSQTIVCETRGVLGL